MAEQMRELVAERAPVKTVKRTDTRWRNLLESVLPPALFLLGLALLAVRRHRIDLPQFRENPLQREQSLGLNTVIVGEQNDHLFLTGATKTSLLGPRTVPAAASQRTAVAVAV